LNNKFLSAVVFIALLMANLFGPATRVAYAQSKISPQNQINWPSSCTGFSTYIPSTGTCQSPSTLNGVVDVTNIAGTDIGDQINKTLVAPICNSQCILYVPAGTYNFTTTISLPLNSFGAYGLWINQGAVLNYTGTGYAIDTPIGTAGPGPANLVITGGSLTGTSAAVAGGAIHILPSQRISIQHMRITGFSNTYAIWLEGPDSMDIIFNNIQNNLGGIRVSPTFCTNSFPYTCNNTLTGATAWSPNLINVQFNQIAVNQRWGIFEDRNGVSGSGWTGSLHNTYENNDFEVNGLGGAQYGAIYIGKSTVNTVRNNYFEASPREIVLGELGSGAFFAANSPIVRDNYFTTRTATPYNIELANTVGAIIEGNSELVSSANSSNCFVNAAASGESQTFLGHNLYFQNTGGNTGNALCINGSPANLLAGANSYAISNTTFQTYIADGFYQTVSTGTSETITLSNITSGSFCFITPANAAAATFPFSVATFYVIPGAGNVTYFHPASSNGVRVNIWCSTT
jgi:hypothetical protein